MSNSLIFEKIYDNDNNLYLKYENKVYILFETDNILYYFETDFDNKINLFFDDNKFYRLNYFDEALNRKENILEIKKITKLVILWSL